MSKQRKRRGNSRYYMFFIVALVGIAGLGFGVYTLLMNVSWFDATDIQYSGNSSVPDSLIIPIIARFKGHNLLSIPKGDIREQLLAFARVNHVEIRKRLPHTLAITINERQGLLYIKSTEGDLYPIDADGLVLEQYDKVYREDLPIVATFLTNAQMKPGTVLSKPYLKKILTLHKQICASAPDFVANISEYYMIDNIIHIIDTRTGTRIIPSETDIAGQLKRYSFVHENGNIKPNSVIDLRFDNQVVVKDGGK